MYSPWSHWFPVQLSGHEQLWSGYRHVPLFWQNPSSHTAAWKGDIWKCHGGSYIYLDHIDFLSNCLGTSSCDQDSDTFLHSDRIHLHTQLHGKVMCMKMPWWKLYLPWSHWFPVQLSGHEQLWSGCRHVPPFWQNPSSHTAAWEGIIISVHFGVCVRPCWQ